MKASCSLLVLAVSILLALLSQCRVAAGEAASTRDLQDGDDVDMLELQVHAFNAPPGALDAIAADAAKYMRFLLGAEPLYDGLEPGDSVPDDGDRDRRARGRTLAKVKEDVEQEDSSTPMIRGGAAKGRTLQMRSCPSSCARSSSTSCKQIGCAYCGTSCRRRQRERNLEAFGAKMATKIEGKINARLLRGCGDAQDCVIFAKILGIGFKADGEVVEKPFY